MNKWLVILIVAATVFFYGGGQKATAQFVNYTMKDGLAFDNVVHLSEDDEGLIYIATNEGLSIYNGYRFLLYNQENNSYFSNKISITLPVKKGFVLIGTEDKGLYLYDKLQDSIISLQASSPNVGKLNINTLYSTQGMIWIGCKDGRLFSFPLKEINSSTLSHPLLNWKLVAQLPFSIEAVTYYQGQLLIGGENEGIVKVENTGSGFLVGRILELEGATGVTSFAVSGKNLFIGTRNGVYQTSNLNTTPFEKAKQLEQSWALANVVVRTIAIQEKKQTLWIGTEGEGLFKFDINGQLLEHYEYSDKKRNSINSNYVLTSLIDGNNNLLVGTWYGGINLLELQQKNTSFIYDRKNEKDIFSNIIWCCIKMPDGKIYLGTHGNGLAIYQPEEKAFESISSSAVSKSILSLYYDKVSKLIFMGTWEHGIRVYNPQTGKLVTTYDNILKGIEKERVYSIVADAQNNLWIGTFKKGLFRFTANRNQLQPIDLPHPKSSETPDIRVIYPNEEDGLWVGSLQQGLFYLNINSKGTAIKIEHYEKFKNTDEPLMVENIYKDSLNNLWLLCRNGLGIKKSGAAPVQLETLKGMVLTGMQADSAHYWISSYKGIYKLNKNLSDISGMITEHVFYDLLYEPASQTLFATSNKGFLKLDLNKPTDRVLEPKIYFADLKVLGTSIGPNNTFIGKNILKQKLNYTNTLVLPYQASTFSLDINTLYFEKNPKTHLQYRLKGYEKVWNNTNGTSANISFTNVPSGSYTFEVRVVDENNKALSQIRTLQVIKAKPWFATLPAILIYLLLSGLIIWWIIQEIQQKVRIKQELQLQKARQEQEQALHKQKIEFFTNISHDLRTPLTLILGPLEDIVHEKEDTVPVQFYKKLAHVHQNANMLMRLVNQILDFRKAETHKLELNLSQIQLDDFIQSIYLQFKELADIKKIDFSLSLPSNNTIIVADPLKLESVLFNLLSNALKFTPENGKTTLTVTTDKNNITIEVADTGIGIPAAEMEQLFTRFYRVTNKSFVEGTGIGMALIKKYVELHKGKIEVFSEENKGSTFNIIIPIPENSSDYKKYVPQLPHLYTEATKKTETIISKSNKSILIIDDNKEIRDYLKESLEQYYRIFIAANGKEGLSLAASKNPNLIISDIMMEELDGLKVCQKIKEHTNTAHIPVILLTAKHMQEAKVTAFQMGADDYIEKPFSIRLLLTRVEKLIEQREKLKSRYLKQDPILKEADPSAMDEEFIEKLTGIIHQHLDEPEYQISELAKSMLMSQDQLYRKVKALTGLSANHFIRHLRLLEAKKLLATKRYSISEIVYKVGFNNASYFTKAFKKEFGVLPKEYLQVIIDA